MRPLDDAPLDIERELRALRPPMRPAFAAELDARAARGFAEPRMSGQRAPRFGLRYALGAVSVIAATAVAVSASGVLQDERTTNQLRGIPQVQSQSGDGAASPDFEEALVGKRRVARTADLTLSAAPEDVSDVAEGVVDVTRRYRGVTITSTVASGETEEAHADFRIKLPARNLQPALDDLSALAQVRSLSNRTEDITNLEVVAERRIEELLLARRHFRSKLAAADTAERIREVRAELRQITRQLEGPRAILERTRERSRFAPVQVTIVGEEEPDTGWSIGDALDDAVRVLEVAVGVTLIALAGSVPVAIVVALLWLAARAWMRSRRERALDEQPG